MKKGHPSNWDGRGNGDVCGRTSDAWLRIAQPRSLNDDRENAALERRGIRMPEPTEHHSDERVVSDPIPTPFSSACVGACNQSEIDFLQLAGGKRVETTMALPQWLASECRRKQTFKRNRHVIVLSQRNANAVGS